MHGSHSSSVHAFPFAHARRLSTESNETGIHLRLGGLYFQSNAKLSAYLMLSATEYKRFVTHGLPAATAIFVTKLKTQMKTLARLI